MLHHAHPLAVKKTPTARGLKVLEEKWQVELDTCLDTLDDGYRTRLCTTKTKVIL